MKAHLKIFFLLTAIGFLLVVLFRRLAIFDDAYITYRYARNLARGLGPVFNAGERVEGCTAFLQMIILAPFAALKMDLRMVSLSVSILCLALIGVVGRAKIFAIQSERRGASAWPWFFPAMIISSPALVTWMISGMETIWLTTAIFMAVAVADGEAKKHHLPVASALLSVLVALLRPEGILTAAMMGLSLLLFEKEKRIRHAVVFGMVFAVPYGIYFLWRYSYYGFLFPNTYYAKVGSQNPLLFARGVLYLLSSLLAGVFPVITIWLLFLVRRRRLLLDRNEKTILMVIAGQAFQTVWTGGDFFMFFRFMVPVWPLFLFLVFSMSEKIFQNRNQADSQRKKMRSLFWRLEMRRPGAIALIFAVDLCMTLYSLNGFKTLVQSGLAREWEHESRLLKPLIPREATVATIAIGAIGYILDLPLIDMAGLTDATIAHTPIQTGREFAGHEKFNTEYVFSRKPDFILACILVSRQPVKQCPLQPGGLAIMPSLTDLLESTDLSKRYIFANHESGDSFVTAYLLRERIGQTGYEGWFGVKEE